MTITLNWTPGAGASSQIIRYKLASVSATPDSNWTVHATVSGTASTATITGLSDNLIYDFQILTECPGGTPSGSSVIKQIKIICPTVTVTKTSSTVSYSFPALGGSVTAYTVKLFDASGTSEIASQTPSGTNPLTGTFTGLTANTLYKIRVLINAGTFEKTDCALVDVTTNETPVCNAPTGLTATVGIDA